MDWAGLGANQQPCHDKAYGRNSRQLVQEKVRAGAGEKKDLQDGGYVRGNMDEVGGRTGEDHLLDQDLTGRQVMTSAIYNVLPSSVNLYICGKTDSPACPLCPGRGSLEHILCSCPTALGEGLYGWLHNQVLKSIAESIYKAMVSNKRGWYRRNITFVRAGEKTHSQPKLAVGLFTWEGSSSS